MRKRIRILHRTAYYYRQPVTFGPHRAMLRPREGHDVHIVKGQYEIEPKAAVRWLRANAAAHRLDPNRICLWGTSAGGHMAAVAGFALLLAATWQTRA